MSEIPNIAQKTPFAVEVEDFNYKKIVYDPIKKGK